jgi:hypothetical protein
MKATSYPFIANTRPDEEMGVDVEIEGAASAE